MMEDEEIKKQKEEELKELNNDFDDNGECIFYSEEFLEKVSKGDIFSAGILILECVQTIPSQKKKGFLKENDLSDIFEICKENYSDFFVYLIERMIDYNESTRWGLMEIQNYLDDIYEFDKLINKDNNNS